MTAQYITVAFSKEILVHRSHSLTTQNFSITNLVLIVHGSERQAQANYDIIVKAATETGNAASTLIMAPHFKVAGDSVTPSELLWLQEGGGASWKTGGEAVGVAISSFDIVDKLIKKVLSSGCFPNLKRVTVTGHSAGGQFTHRYAAGNLLEPLYPAVKFSYVPANPSSFLYLTTERPILNVADGYMMPVQGCARYNYYHYGLLFPNRYMGRITADQTRLHLRSRRVILLLGDADTRTDDGLDVSCGANLQGENRYDRGIRLIAYMNNYFTPHNHTFSQLTGVGHSSGDVYRTSVARSVLWPAP